MPTTQAGPTGALERLVRRARGIVLVERMWPAAVLALSVAALFVTVSWLGLWTVLPRSLRIPGVAAFGAGLAAAVVLALRSWRVSRADALRRLDRDSGLPHRPLSASEDRLANAGDDPLTRALWDRSRRQLDAVLRTVRVRPPAPRMVDHDPYALRFAALLALAAAGFAAGVDKAGLIEAAFDWRGTAAAAAVGRVDVWIDPPGYTGRPPVVLTTAHEDAGARHEVAVPVHSAVVVRWSGMAAPDVRSEGGLHPAAEPPREGPAPQPAVPRTERRLTVEGSGTLTVRAEGAAIGPLAITAIADRAPTIALLGRPAPTARGGLTLGYTIGDDYGVVGAEADFADPAPGDDTPMVRSLVPPPKLALALPSAPGGLGKGQTTADISDHPWAGSEVAVTLTARDEGGNQGSSAPVRITLPARPFANPLARALVEQRRKLVFDPDHRDGIGLALDALMIDPDRFGTSPATYLGLYTARERLAAARNDADLVALADYLWQIALKVEDGALGQAARDLRAAEQALREALQRGAPADEIKRLTDELHRQMDRFLAEMMQRRDQDARQDRPDSNAKVVTQQQLQDMMKRMGELAEKGDTAEAQRMLDQLQAMLDNLRTARRPSPGDQAAREMNRQMNELQKMTREQQGLRDRTFDQGRDGRDPDGSQNASPQDQDQAQGEGQQPGQQGAGQDLQNQQGGLRERLQQLEKAMRDLGLRDEPGLGEAEQAMKEAEDALGRGRAGNRKAVDAQGRALQGLQKGAGGVSQQMAQGQVDEPGQGQGQGGQAGEGANADTGDDPLGRRREGRGPMEMRGNALDEGVAARAQQVLQELRRRLANPNRPTDELDYLERLLQSN